MKDKRLMANTLGAALLIIAALIVGAVLTLTRPQVERVERVDLGELVSVIETRQVHRAPRVQAQGTVVPARSVEVTPQVSGRVLSRHQNLVSGGVVRRGETLLRIDPRDFQLAVDEAQNGVERAQAELAMEEGRQVVARQEWERFGTDGEDPPPLALREPQRRQAELQIEAARNTLERAQLDLERTRITAPFTALVQDASVQPGQLISSSTTAADLVALDEFWVQVSVPLESLDMLAIPGRDGKEGSNAEVRHRSGERVVTNPGKLVRLLGELDPAGRMARVVVRVEDPFAMVPEASAAQVVVADEPSDADETRSEATGPEDETSGVAQASEDAADNVDDEANDGSLAAQPPKIQRAPLLLGSYVTVIFEGAEERHVVEVPRRAVHNGNEVFVVGEGNRLEVRRVEFAWRDVDTLAVSKGLEGGEQLIVSPLAAPVEGMALRVQERKTHSATDARPEGAGDAIEPADSEEEL